MVEQFMSNNTIELVRDLMMKKSEMDIKSDIDIKSEVDMKMTVRTMERTMEKSSNRMADFTFSMEKKYDTPPFSK